MEWAAWWDTYGPSEIQVRCPNRLSYMGERDLGALWMDLVLSAILCRFKSGPTPQVKRSLMDRYGMYHSEMIGAYKIPPVKLQVTKAQNRRATAKASRTQRAKYLLRRLDDKGRLKGGG